MFQLKKGLLFIKRFKYTVDKELRYAFTLNLDKDIFEKEKS